MASFKAPTPLEKAHDFLWRIHTACPPSGIIGIFNRSHYEDVFFTRVHGWITEQEARSRYPQITDFEGILAKRGIRILKFLLHISAEGQKKRLLARLDDPEKRWKFSPADHKWYRNLVVADRLVHALEDMNPQALEKPDMDLKKLRHDLGGK